MSPLTNKAADTFDLLAEREQYLVLELMQLLLSDDVETLEDTKAHMEAVAEYKRGESIPHSAINWD